MHKNCYACLGVGMNSGWFLSTWKVGIQFGREPFYWLEGMSLSGIDKVCTVLSYRTVVPIEMCEGIDFVVKLFGLIDGVERASAVRLLID